MSVVWDNVPRLAALCLAACGLYIFMTGASDRQLRVLDDGSLVDPCEKNLVSFKYPKSILSLNAGFGIYRSISYGVSSFCLLLDLVVGSGYLTLPALFIAAGEIVNDFSDFFVAVFLVGKNIGLYPAAAYGLTYLTLLVIESLLWFGTCKYHESCQEANVAATDLKIEKCTLRPPPNPHGAIRGGRAGGRRSSSIGCRSLLGRRSSVGLVFITCQDPNRLLTEINSQLALFRDMLIHIGQPKDCPELREKIRKHRRSLVEGCKHTSQLLLPQIKSAVAEGIPADNPHFVLLFFMIQLFLRELAKCSRLVQVVPMDMSSYYAENLNRPGTSNFSNVISQILLCKTITPDFNAEEICSIAKDSEEIEKILQEMQEYMPQQENQTEKNVALVGEEVYTQWAKNRRSSFYNNMGSFCCMCRPNYL